MPSPTDTLINQVMKPSGGTGEPWTWRSDRTSSVSRDQNIAKNHETLIGINLHETLAKDSCGL